MKKILLFIFLICGTVLNVSAQYMTVQVHGTVTRDSTNAPVPNHEVFIGADSNSVGYYFYASRFTNQNGYYDCTINNVPSSVPITFTVKTKNCDSLFILKTFLNLNSPVEENFVLCNSTPCNAYFEYQADSTSPLHVHFWDSEMPEGSVVSYSWDFGDGSPFSTNADPWHVYPQQGIYTVCLTLSTIYGTTCSYCNSITVGEINYMTVQVHGTVTRDSTNAPVPNHEVFIEADSNSVGYYFYTSRFTNQNGYYDCTINNVPSSVPITFTVKTKNCDSLFILKTFLNLNSPVEENFVLCNSTPCNAYFEYQADSTSPLHVHFWDSEMPEGSVVSYLWDFGDGSSFSTNADPWHVYPQQGLYTVCLTLSTIYGITCTYCNSIPVGENNYMTVLVHGTVTRDSTNAPVPYHEVFIEADSNSVGYYFYKARLTNSNGYYDCTINNVPSNVPITFLVKTKNCDSAFILKSFVSQNTPAEVNFTICNDSVSCNAHYHFMADSLNPLHVHFWNNEMPQGSIASYLWHFGDCSASTNPDPWHTYTHAGRYNVCLTITTISGSTCTYCDSIPVNINYNCISFVQAETHFLTVNLHGSTESPYPTTYTWHMGDPAETVLTGQDVTFTYPESGVYPVVLHTVDSLQCEYDRTYSLGVFATCDLNGYVYADSAHVDSAKVYLIRVLSNNQMILLDSTYVQGPTGYYHFGGVEPGDYFTKAQLLPESEFYGLYVPTYHLNAVYWQQADTIFPNPPNPYYNILMAQMSQYTPGSGRISGMVTKDAKISSGGTPAAGVEVLLLDDASVKLGYAITGSDGRFSFPEIANGSYKVYPEFPGKTTTPASVTLDDSITSANINFVIKGDKISLGIDDHFAKEFSSISSVYPNPVRSKASMIIEVQKDMDILVTVCSVTGPELLKSGYSLKKGKNIISWDNASWPEGVYFVKISDGSGSSVARKFIIGR